MSLTSPLPIFFAGEFSHGMDSKGRITIPSAWRSSDADQFYFMPDSSDRWLRAMRPEDFFAAAQNPPDKPAARAEQMEFQRWFCSRAQILTADKQGRLVLPESLRTAVELGTEIVIVGTLNAFEVWNKQLWEQTKREKKQDFQLTARERGL